MASLELVLDATGMQRGSAIAKTSLQDVKSAATDAALAVARVGSGQQAGGATGSGPLQTLGEDATKAQRAFASLSAAGNSLQIGTGIAQAARAMGQFNFEVAAFQTARVALDFGQLTASVGRVGLSFSTLGAIMRAHPIFLLATAIGTVASIMSLIAGSTDKATESFQRQAQAVDGLLKKTRELDIRRGYGEFDERQGVAGTVSALTAIRTSDKLRYGPAEAAGLFGVSEQDLRYALARSGLGEGALEGRISQFQDSRALARGEAPRFNYAMQDFSAQQIAAAGEDLLRQRQATAGRGFAVPPYQSPFGSRNYVESTFNERLNVANDEFEKAQAEFRMMQESARQVGEYLGDGIADAVLQLRSAREVIASIAADMARMGIRSAVGSLAANFAGAFNPTATQAQTAPMPGAPATTTPPHYLAAP